MAWQCKGTVEKTADWRALVKAVRIVAPPVEQAFRTATRAGVADGAALYAVLLCAIDAAMRTPASRDAVDSVVATALGNAHTLAQVRAMGTNDLMLAAFLRALDAGVH